MTRWRIEYAELQEHTGLLSLKTLGSELWSWQQEMVPLVREEFEKIKEAEMDRKAVGTESTTDTNGRLVYGPFLQVLSADNLPPSPF